MNQYPYAKKVKQWMSNIQKPMRMMRSYGDYGGNNRDPYGFFRGYGRQGGLASQSGSQMMAGENLWNEPDQLQQPEGPPNGKGNVFFPGQRSHEGPAWSRNGQDPSRGNYFWNGIANPWVNSNSPFQSTWGTQAPYMSPGYFQGPTQIPTFFNAQGYPFAVPAGSGFGDSSTNVNVKHMGQQVKPH